LYRIRLYQSCRVNNNNHGLDLIINQLVNNNFLELEWVQWEITCWNIGEPSSKAKYCKFSDSEKYCEGNFWKVSSKLGEIDCELVIL